MESSGVSAMVTEVTASVKLARRASISAGGRRHADADEGEFASRTEQQAGLDRDRP